MSNARAETADPRVAVVIITHNRYAELARTLRLLDDLPEAPRVIVVDNGSRDGTLERMSTEFPTVIGVGARGNLGGAGRTLGVELADEPYVAFCDDDTWWGPGSLRRAADVLDQHPQIAVVTARILVGAEEREDPICAEMAESPLPKRAELPGCPLMSFLAGASVVRRDAYLDAGGFEPRLFIGGEEELLAMDLLSRGWALRYLAELVVHHHPSRARDAHERRGLGIRNTLWTTWLRRPLPSAIRRSARLMERLPRDRVTVRGVAAAVAGLPWVLRERRVVPRDVEELLAMMDTPQLDSRARRYVS